MRYVVFTDIHANLEALEAVLAKIDEIAEKEPIDGIWFLGDLVGYGPNPNECITILRERTDVIIAGNHDWAAVGKIDLDDFSAAARISAEWTAEQLTGRGLTVYALDLRGRGRSEGERFYVNDIEEYARDISDVVDLAKSRAPDMHVRTRVDFQEFPGHL